MRLNTIRSIRPGVILPAMGIALVVGVTGAQGAGPVTEAWVARYNGAASSYDQGNAVAVDADGNVVITGPSYGSGTGADFQTIKYNGETGEPLWAVRYDGPGSGYDEPRSIAVDAAGNVVVAGISLGATGSNDYATIKYNGGTGAPLWTARYNGPGNGADGVNSLAVDAAGNVVVTGQSFGTPGSAYATIKYNGSTGEPLWTIRYQGPGNGNDSAAAVAVDAAGNVIVTGSSSGGATQDDFATVKYNGATGAPEWTARYDGPGNGLDTAYDTAVDADGNVIVTGYSYGGGATLGDYATVKYDGADGDVVWTARYNGPNSGGDGASALAVDPSGDVFVTGYSDGGAAGRNYATVKYDGESGASLWTSRYAGPDAGDDAAQAIVIDASGDAVVTGYSSGGAQGTDYATIKYAGATGASVWTIRYNGGGSYDDATKAIAVGPAGSVLVTGGSYGGVATGYDFATIKYSTPLPATDVTSSCQVTRSGLRKNLRTGRWAQTVTLTNTSSVALTGQLSLVLDNLSSNATLFNNTGYTLYALPAGKPYQNNGNEPLPPGGVRYFTLEFINPTNAAITWTPRVLAGSGAR